MSYELANEDWVGRKESGLLGQFASTQGYGDLVKATKGYPILSQFFKDGVFPDISTTGNWEAAGHYSQVVWRNTTEVGGGLATGQGQDFLVCYYNPAGNVTGETAY